MLAPGGLASATKAHTFRYFFSSLPISTCPSFNSCRPSSAGGFCIEFFKINDHQSDESLLGNSTGYRDQEWRTDDTLRLDVALDFVDTACIDLGFGGFEDFSIGDGQSWEQSQGGPSLILPKTEATPYDEVTWSSLIFDAFGEFGIDDSIENHAVFQNDRIFSASLDQTLAELSSSLATSDTHPSTVSNLNSKPDQIR